jgi:hypothetical protein
VNQNPEWELQLRGVARSVRRVVPRGARIAVVDKWDPTLLHLCRREGWHFPDLELSPGGYPKDSEGAISHLRQLMDRGAHYLVLPEAYRWWLDHYAGFREHLDGRHRQVSADPNCIIYELL